MSMSKKDYVLLASCVKCEVVALERPVNARELAMLDAVAKNMARVFAAGNPNFDRARFLAACGTV
ncbi:hypothetical protein UFOVP1326_22 [uncultured Caudovirales phage]|uniref:Uncharacterized protein n=1 Tax=uncultured Caudovirales phage TaxID=2100421 RepID=A0A6J5RXU2_9CAUD|nr:hypothetical protein UFOVP1326_22 [uncultured Caudovirales phage]CAB4212527.1 hypothetical protein UFOVP1436_17 [uncultured Caudovirales phage]